MCQGIFLSAVHPYTGGVGCNFAKYALAPLALVHLIAWDVDCNSAGYAKTKK